ncbi:MAG: tetratricopeptide repeat protein [Candidatus Kapaibacterium sp.]
MIKNIIIPALLIILVTAVHLFGQNVNEQKFRLAESFESNGDFYGAVRLYSELMKDVPNNTEYFNGYVRSMKALSNYSELLDEVNKRIQNSETLEILDLHAELCWRTGQPGESDKSWEKALSKYSDSQRTYLTISQTQINLRLFEKAINTLLKGRSNIGDPRLFNDPLIKLYIATGDYRSGTDEIVNLLNNDYNLPQAQGRLFALMINDEAREYVGSELKNASENKSDNIVYQEAYAWFLRTTGSLDEALKIIEKIDKLKRTNGLEILNFASSAVRDGEYDIAVKAYKIIIDYGKQNPYHASALFGFTRALEQKFASSKDNIDKKAAAEIIESYNKIIQDFPRSGNAADSRLRLSMIYSDILKDNHKAINELDKLIKEFPSSQYAVSAYLELGDLLIINNELDKAEMSFNKVRELHRFATAQQKDRAMYMSALLVYFSGEIEKAVQSFEILALNPDTDIANDILNKLFIINSDKEKIAAQRLYAQAELKEFQGRSDEALKHLYECAELAEGSPLGENALFKSAEICFKTAQYIECRKLISNLNEKYPESKLMDRRVMLLADSYYNEANFGEALKFYTELITKYPESIFLQEARKKIRIIRKDNI